MPSPTFRTMTMRLNNIPSRVRIFSMAISTMFIVLYLLRLCLSSYSGPEGFIPKGPPDHPHRPYYSSQADLTPSDITQAAQNESLGFGKIFYISLPYRTDRQDSMSLLAASTNIKLNLQPAVIGSNIHDKAKPNEAGNLRPEQLGCWRSHADVWRKVVDEGIDTALILEDDLDWDVNVHDVFQELSVQMKKGKLRREKATAYETEHAPYGLDWDLFYIGSCWDIPNSENRPKHQAYVDPYGPNEFEMSGAFSSEIRGWGEKVSNTTRTRVIAPSWYSVCTIGYAVTRIGAQKLLYTVGGAKGIGSAIDLTMTDRVQQGYLRALTVVPPLVTTWKFGTLADSDIDDQAEKEKELGSGAPIFTGSENLQRSARRFLEERLATPEKKNAGSWLGR